MTRKEPRWVVAFLRALERCGEVRRAAEDAGVDFSTAYARRRAHAEFGAAWAEALARFRAAKDAAREAELAETMTRVRKAAARMEGARPKGRPSPGSPAASPTSPARGRGEAPPPHCVRSPSPANAGEDEEMVIRPSAKGAPKLVRASAGRWSKAREEEFLAELATSGNLRRACKAVGLSPEALSKRRLRDQWLDAACDAAVDIARTRLNGLLVELGNRTFDPDDLPLREDRGELPKISVAEAIQIAKMGQSAKVSRPRAAPEPEPPQIEAYDVGEVARRLQEKLAAIEAESLRDGWIRDEETGAMIPPGWVRAQPGA